MQSFAELYDRLDATRANISTLRESKSRLDLNKMWRNALAVWRKVDQEAVVCRKLGHDTPKMAELMQLLEETLDQIDSNVTFAALLI